MIGAALIARMSSRRLPGKVLTKVAGVPLLGYSLDRLRHCGLELRIVVATSLDPSDDPLEEFANAEGIDCVRGSLDDVAGRFVKAIETTGADAIFRVNGDSPLIETALFRRAASEFASSKPDLVTNIMPRRYPPGVSVELLRSSSYVESYQKIVDDEDREHVTRFFYRHRNRFRIVNLEPEESYGDLHLAIDTEADLEAFKRVVGLMKRPHWDYGLDEIVELYNHT